VSGLLDGLPTLNVPVPIKDDRWDTTSVTNAIAWVKRDDVREALRSDKTRRAMADAVESRCEGLLSRRECETVAAGIAAVLAGDDR
jgi:hypothetical protein